MLQGTSNKNTPNCKRIYEISINQLPTQFAQYPRSPAFTRKNSINKKDKFFESAKSSEQKSLQKSLKYTKIMPRSPKCDISEVHSEVLIIDLLTNKMQDSQATITHRKSRSKNHTEIFFPNKKRSKDKSSGKYNPLEMSARQPAKRITKVDEHYIYWKNKAHQYLELNIKLMNDVRRLTRQNQHIKTTLAECQESLKINKETDSTQLYNQKTLSREIRNISSIYMSKIEGMEKELKRKEIVIASYELNIKQLSIRLVGDLDRIKLITKLQQQIARLKDQLFSRQTTENIKLYTYESTSTLLFQNSNR